MKEIGEDSALAVRADVTAETDVANMVSAALERFGPLYQAALARQFLWRLGLHSRGFEADYALIAAAEKSMRERALSPDAFFHQHRFGRNAEGDLAGMLDLFSPAGEAHALWQEDSPPSLVIDNVEAIWSAIDQRDDWGPLHETIAAIRRLGTALGPPPAVMV